MKKTINTFLLLLLSLMVVGCSSDEGNSGDTTNQPQNQKEQKVDAPQKKSQETSENNDQAKVDKSEELDAKEMPKNIEEIIDYPIGIFGSEDIKIGDDTVKELLYDIPALSEDAKDTEIKRVTNYLYSLFKMPYTDPRNSIEESTLSNPELGKELASKEQYNVEIVLDASGSMANYMGAKTRMDLAKESIEEFASTLPEDVNLSLRVYGHEGSGSDADKKMSCAANELVYESQSYNASELSSALSSFEPAGWTPLAQSIVEAKEDLSKFSGEEHKNIVYIVSDGIETCDGDPVAAAKDLKDSGISPVVNVIGFDLANKDEQQLKEIAKAADGSYVNVNNQNQLNNELEKTIKDSQKWIEWSNSETLSALGKTNKEILKIIKIESEWQSKLAKEERLIISSVYELQDNNKISNEQTDEMISNVKKFYNDHYSSVKEMNDILIDLSKENLDDTLAEINRLYEKNISN